MTLGKRSRFQPRTPGRAVDRDRDDRRAGLQRDPAEPGFGLPSSPLRERPPSAYISSISLLVEELVGGLEGLLVVVAAADREDAAVLKMQLRTGGPKSCDLAMNWTFRRR